MTGRIAGLVDWAVATEELFSSQMWITEFADETTVADLRLQFAPAIDYILGNSRYPRFAQWVARTSAGVGFEPWAVFRD